MTEENKNVVSRKETEDNTKKQEIILINEETIQS